MFLFQVEITVYQLFLIGIGVGALLGLIPLILGLVKKEKKLAILGFAFSVIGGAIWSPISLLVALVFVWLILKRGKSEMNEETPADTADPA